jgi:hypothetical protein
MNALSSTLLFVNNICKQANKQTNTRLVRDFSDEGSGHASNKYLPVNTPD